MSSFLRSLARGFLLSLVLSACGAPAGAATGRALSLNALASAVKAGPSAEAARLCGITRVTGFVVDGNNKDVVLIGEPNPDLPPLHLDDFVVAARSAWLVYGRTEGRVRYYSAPGCSIDPDPKVIRELQQIGAGIFASSGPDAVEASLNRWREVGGRAQKVRVMGVPFDTRFAKVMVDADYYMKRLVNGSVALDIGGFDSLSDITIEAMRADIAADRASNVPMQTMSRFWFHPAEATYSEEDGTVVLESCRVGLLTEEEFLTEQGQVAGRGRPEPLAREFARGFTAHYAEIAAARPVYAELEALFRFVAVAKILKSTAGDSAAISYLLNAYPVGKVAVNRAVLGLTNVKQFSETRETPEGTATMKLWLPSCGGVSMDVKPRRVKARNLSPKPSPARGGEPAASKPKRGGKLAKPAPSPAPEHAASPSRAPGLKGSPSRPGRGLGGRSGPTLKKTVLAARKSPGALSWDFPVPASQR